MQRLACQGLGNGLGMRGPISKPDLMNALAPGGLVGGLLVVPAIVCMDRLFKIDDPVGAI